MIHKRKVAKNKWKLNTSIRYEKHGIPVTVPVDFLTDGLSLGNLPQPLLWVLRFIFKRWHRRYEKAVVLHDYLYRKATQQERVAVARAMRLIHQDGAVDDGLLRLAADMVMLKLSRGWYRKPMYAAVRLFGEKAWQ